MLGAGSGAGSGADGSLPSERRTVTPEQADPEVAAVLLLPGLEVHREHAAVTDEPQRRLVRQLALRAR
eukprot:COSAG06_NODE_7195_length_2589_cov_1.346185_2_plen_68_part_00